MKKVLLSMQVGIAMIIAAMSFSRVASADRGIGPVMDRCRALSHAATKEAEEFYDEIYSHGHGRDPQVMSTGEEYLGSIREFARHLKRIENVQELKEKFEEVRSKYRALKAAFDVSPLNRYPKMQKRFNDLRAPFNELSEVVDRA